MESPTVVRVETNGVQFRVVGRTRPMRYWWLLSKEAGQMVPYFEGASSDGFMPCLSGFQFAVFDSLEDAEAWVRETFGDDEDVVRERSWTVV